MTERVCIILPVHNRRAITEAFVDCLLQQTEQSYHLILIDDGSTDGTAEMVRARIRRLSVISGNGNWWWAGSLQRGVNWLNDNVSDVNMVVLIVNDDVRFTADFLQTAVQLLDENPATLVLAQFQDVNTRQPIPTGVEVDFSRLTITEVTASEKVNCLSTRGLFMRWGDMKKIGNFHPCLLPHYLSDYEFTIRAHRKGMKLLTSPDLMLIPNPAATGFRNFEAIGFRRFYRQFFSKKSVGNPIYWTSFIILACPLRWIPINLYRVWKLAVLTVAKNAWESLAAR